MPKQLQDDVPLFQRPLCSAVVLISPYVHYLTSQNSKRTQATVHKLALSLSYVFAFHIISVTDTIVPLL